MATFSDFGIEVPPGATGGEIRTTCPQCSGERKKSREKCLSVSLSDGVWNCHHCGWSGGLKNKNVKIFTRPKFEYKEKINESLVAWFKGRGISEKTLIDNKIYLGNFGGGKKSIQFPYFKNGQVVNIKHRTRDKQFRQEKNAEKCLYRFDAIKLGKGGSLIISEGEIDALSFVEAGFEYAASIPDGAPSPNTKNFTTKFDFLKSAEKIFDQYEKIIIATDNDPPGITARNELARRIGPERCLKVDYPEGCKDANDVLVKHGTDGIKNIIKNARPLPISGVITQDEMRDEVLDFYRNGMKSGIKTGWSSIDKLYTVFPGQLTVVTGIPNSGKSNWLDNLVLNLAISEGWKIAMFSPENWPPYIHTSTLAEKMLRKPFRNSWYSRSDPMTENQLNSAITELNEYIFEIMPKDEIMTVDVILKKTEQLILRYGINGLVIDPWNEVEHDIGMMREDQYISISLGKIRRFARLHGIHIWIVAHPKNLTKPVSNGKENTGDKYPPPTMYDISGGAHWRNKADNGICVDRPDKELHVTDIYIQKIRFKWVGKIGLATLRYSNDCGIYFDQE